MAVFRLSHCGSRILSDNEELNDLLAMTTGFSLPGSRLGKPLPLVKLVDNFDASYSYVANEGTVFTFLTNLNAPLYR
jgi:hypothetical protein